MNALHLVMIVDLIIVALLIFCQFEMKRDCLFHYSALETLPHYYCQYGGADCAADDTPTTDVCITDRIECGPITTIS